ncbi:MAG: two-component system sensor protein histidine kinase [Bacteroidetes bacterium]|nr:two-component system sensor protein histidine kinase [Bacteroidota bacterium]
MKKKQFWQYIVIVLIISLFLGILIHFSTILERFGLEVRGGRGRTVENPIVNTISEVFISSMVAFGTFILNYFIIRPLDSTIRADIKRISASIILTLISVTILSDSFFAIKRLLSDSNLQKSFNLIYTSRDIFTGIVVLSCILLIKAVYDKQAIRIENETLKRQNLVTQYESLKNQVSPHFLFNSLTALKELINQDTGNAQNYINHLSQVLRYTLQSNQSRTRSLKEEMEVSDSYIFLLQTRFGNNLLIEKQIDEKYESYRLPPLAIQTLLENAIKHNEISKRHPLTITIETKCDQAIRMTNIIRERNSPEFSSGVGLSNLAKQYMFLSGKEILISRKNNEFLVEIPLLTPNDNESNNS